MGEAMVDQIVTRVLAAIRPELEALRQLVERAPADGDGGPLLTREELAAALRLSEATLKRWDREGCPRVNIGDRLPRYRLAAVLTWRAESQEKKERAQASPGAPKRAVVRLVTRGRR